MQMFLLLSICNVNTMCTNTVFTTNVPCICVHFDIIYFQLWKQRKENKL